MAAILNTENARLKSRNIMWLLLVCSIVQWETSIKLATWLAEEFCTHGSFLPLLRTSSIPTLYPTLGKAEEWKHIHSTSTAAMPWLPDGWVGSGEPAQKFRAPCGFCALRGQRQLGPVLRKGTIHNTIFSFPPAREIARSCLDAAQALHRVWFWWQTNVN